MTFSLPTRMLGASVLLCCGFVSVAWAQPGPDALLKPIVPRELGPTNMGGRVHNFAVYEKEPRIFYVATAGGGLWKTTSGGIKFSPVFQFQNTVALGDVTIDQSNPDHVWVGMGEENSRNSTSWGDGVYESTDGGKTWTHKGLSETGHISEVVMHPKDKNVLFVGALGDLWNESEHRGVYKSTDGGKTWTKSLFVDQRTGVIDMSMDPRKPDTIVVAMYERFRWPWKFASGGPGSGLYKTTDGGKTWKKITKGLPEGVIGRIGLDRMVTKPDVMIATVEAEKERGVYKSTDGGESWTFLNALNPRPFYFSTPRIDPVDENRVYVPGVNFHYSDDGGKNFKILQMDIHVDHHDLWIDPTDNNHMILGNDGGVAQTRDRGLTWEHLNNMPLGQFYAVGYDMRKPYWVYGGLQDNGTWGGPTQSHRGAVTFADFVFINGGDGFHAQADPNDWRIVYAESQGGALVRHNMETGERAFIRPRPPQGETYRFNWSSPIVLSPHNSSTVWFGGNKLFKSVNRGDTWIEASPDLTTNDPAKQAPRAGVSPEDTGAERHCTIITISESSLKPGVVWVGTDDGKVQLTQDDGKTWTEVGANISGVPANTWVSRVAASRHVLGRAYVTFDGHRTGDKNSYVYVTEDFGATWKKLSDSLPKNHVAYSFAEGRQNPDLLFLGTEMGIHVSFDRGASWTRFHQPNGFPTVRVDDLVIHPREQDLIVATHGRSLWIVPIAALEQLTAKNREEAVFLCKPTPVYNFGRVFGGWFEGDRHWTSPNTQPGTTIYYFLKEATTEKVEITVETPAGENIGRLNGTSNAGLNGVRFAPRGGRSPLRSGDMIVTLKVGEKTFKTTVAYEDTVGTTTGNRGEEYKDEEDEDGKTLP